VFSEVVVVYRDYDIFGLPSAARGAISYTPYCRHFTALREMNRVRAFQVVLCADVWEHAVVDAVRALEQAVVWFGGFLSEPLVVSRSRGSSPTFTEEQGGASPYRTIPYYY